MHHETKSLRLLRQPQAMGQEDGNVRWNLKSQAKPQEAGSLLMLPSVPITQERGIKTLWFHCEILCSYTNHWLCMSRRLICWSRTTIEKLVLSHSFQVSYCFSFILFFFRTNFAIFCVWQNSTHPGCIVLSAMTNSLPQRWIPLRGQQGGLLRITWMKKIISAPVSRPSQTLRAVHNCYVESLKSKRIHIVLREWTSSLPTCL